MLRQVCSSLRSRRPGPSVSATRPTVGESWTPCNYGRSAGCGGAGSARVRGEVVGVGGGLEVGGGGVGVVVVDDDAPAAVDLAGEGVEVAVEEALVAVGAG